MDPPAPFSWAFLPCASAPRRLCGDPPPRFYALLYRASGFFLAPQNRLSRPSLNHLATPESNLIHHHEKCAKFHLTISDFGLKKESSFNGKSPDFGAKTDLGSSPLVAPQEGLCTTYCVFRFTRATSFGVLVDSKL
jgi:hypothetical protein